MAVNASVELPDLGGKKETLSVRISFVKLHILIKYTDNKSAVPLADIRVSQESELVSEASLACAINNNGTSCNLKFGDADSLQTFVSYFNQTQQQYVQDVDSLRKALTGNTDKAVPIPFLNAVIPILYCNQSVKVEQVIHNIYWFFVNLSPEEKSEYAPFLHNLINYLKTNCSVIPEMVKSLESFLTTADKEVNPFSYADIHLYYSDWILLISHRQGKVYQAVDNLTGEKVAVKMYENSNHLKSIKNEIRSLCSLRDIPSIVHILQAYCYNGVYYLVEELMQGMTLLDYVKTKGPLKEGEARIVIRILLETLSKCHERHILHRDIKLDNVMFRTPENRMEDVVLLDFGFSTVASADLVQSYSRTKEYLSPEVLNNSLYSAKTDMWSLGVLFYGLVTGFFPFGYRTDNHPKERNKKGIPTENDHLKEIIANGRFTENNRFKQLTGECKDLIHHLLEVDSSKRYSAEEALKHEWFVSNEENSVDAIQCHRQTINNRSTKNLNHNSAEETLDQSTFINDDDSDMYDSFYDASIPFDSSAPVSSKRSRRTMTLTRAVYIILRETEVHRIPEDGVVLFKVSPPLEMPVTSIYINWGTNEMWVQVQGNMYYDNQPDRIEGKWVLCQRGSHSPYAMDRECALYRGLENTPLFVLSTPSIGNYCLVYPKNHYVIISKVIRNGKDEFGEISDQSLLVFTLSQDKEIARDLPNGYLVLSQNGRADLERLLSCVSLIPYRFLPSMYHHCLTPNSNQLSIMR